MGEGSHHKIVNCTLRITNSGKILSYWFKHPHTGELIHTLCDNGSFDELKGEEE